MNRVIVLQQKLIMPSCVIKCCRNNSSLSKKPQGITFHRKSNKLSKEIIPRIVCTVDYILELEKRKKEGLRRLKSMRIQKAIRNLIDELFRDILIQISMSYIEPPQEEIEANPDNAFKISSTKCDFNSPDAIELEPQNDDQDAQSSAKHPNFKQDYDIQCIIKQIEQNTKHYSLPKKEKNSENTMRDYDVALQKNKSSSTENLEYTLERDSQTKKPGSPFPKQFQKVFIIGQQPIPLDKSQTLLNKTLSLETKSITGSQQSKEVEIQTPKDNSMTTQSQTIDRQSRQSSEKDQQSEIQSRITISETPTYIPSAKFSSASPETKESQLYEIENIQVPESSNLKAPRLKSLSPKTSKAEPEKVPSKVASIVKKLIKLLPKISRKHELVVIKHPEELFDYNHDEFIPPVARMNFAIQANIVNIEELRDEEETLVDEKESVQHNELVEDGEAFETGEWFETADTEKIEISTKIDVSSGSATVLSDKATGTSSELYSKCELPAKQCSESHLQVSDDPLEQTESISDNFVKALEQFKSSHGETLSKDYILDKKIVQYLDNKFKSTSELDHTLTEKCLDILKSNETDNKLKILPTTIPRSDRGYEYIVDSESDEESDFNDLAQLQKIIRRRRKFLKKPLKIVNSEEIYENKSESDLEE